MNGLAPSDALLSGDEARKAIAAAWGYGAVRSVPAASVAEAMAHVHDPRNQSSAVVSDLDLRSFKQVASPEAAAVAMLPEETVVDTLPAVRFVMQSSARGFRPSIATAIFHPDGRVEMRFERLPCGRWVRWGAIEMDLGGRLSHHICGDRDARTAA